MKSQSKSQQVICRYQQIDPKVSREKQKTQNGQHNLAEE
jgi:hypothetical protein